MERYVAQLSQWGRTHGKEYLSAIGGILACFIGPGIGFLLYHFVLGEPRGAPLDPPGWECVRDNDPYPDQCYPADGYHFELNAHDEKIAVHDIIRSEEERKKDLDTADGWHLLNNDERQAILDGHATIYDYVEFK